MSEIQVAHCFGNVPRFLRIEASRLSFADSAEATMPCADVSSQHEGGRAVGPTLKNVWAAGFLTNSVQVQSFNQLQHMILIAGIAQANL